MTPGTLAILGTGAPASLWRARCFCGVSSAFEVSFSDRGHRETTQKRMAVYRAQRDARRATIKEAIEYCASNPVLHERMKAVFWAEMSISAGSAT